MRDSGWVNPCLTETWLAEFCCSHANRKVVCNSITSQKSAPKIASPIKPSLPNQAEVEKAKTTYISVGSPNPRESKLFQRTVNNFSFVIGSVLPVYPFPIQATSMHAQ